MSEQIRIAGIIEESIVDGPGIRYVVFTQGCPHHCKGCHNPQSHDFNGGRFMSIEDIIKDVQKNPLITGVTFSGGEPVCQAEQMVKLAKKLKNIGKHLMMYTGYTYEELMQMDAHVKELFELCDIVVDGEFKLEQKSLLLKFRGSKNQRIIDVKKTVQEKEVVMAEV